jgi:hypothetical protein
MRPKIGEVVTDAYTKPECGVVSGTKLRKGDGVIEKCNVPAMVHFSPVR